jgi:hypothetical protein
MSSIQHVIARYEAIPDLLSGPVKFRNDVIVL